MERPTTAAGPREHLGLEHSAWGWVVSELRKRGVGDINAGGKDEPLHDAIAAWGEELAQLRMHDPNPQHAEDALAMRREAADRWAKP
jgi:hypothetical protein